MSSFTKESLPVYREEIYAKRVNARTILEPLDES
jgi:hypothetical protein